MGKIVGALFAVALAVAGGLIGLNSTTPRYQSSGLIEFKRSLPRLLYETEHSRPMAAYDAFVETEVRKIGSREVVSSAMKSRSWTALGRDTTPGSVSSFTANLEVEHPSGTNHVVITFEDGDPRAARAGVNAVIDSYMERYGSRDGAEYEQLLETLRKLQGEWQDELALKNSQLLSHAEDLGVEAVSHYYRQCVEELNRLERECNEVRLQLAFLEDSDAAPGSAQFTASRSKADLLERRLEQAKGNAKTVFVKHRKLESLRKEKTLLQERLETVGRRINEIEVEGQVHGRITVAQRGYRPFGPLPDRKGEHAAAGAGIGLVVGLFLAAGLLPLLRRRRS